MFRLRSLRSFDSKPDTSPDFRAGLHPGRLLALEQIPLPARSGRLLLREQQAVRGPDAGGDRPVRRASGPVPSRARKGRGTRSVLRATLLCTAGST